MTEKNRDKFDLEERTAGFGESAIQFAKKIPKNTVTASLISQFVRSATSVGANYCEADDARKLWQEAKELNLIFSKIFKSCQDG